MLNVVLFGPPGAGKGTQSGNIIEIYKLVHLSTGDILRGEISIGSELGLKAKTLMDQGILVPDEVVIDMISSRIDENPQAKGFIFDGFPRTIAQAEALDRMLSDKGTSISCMLSLKVSDEELIHRLVKRGKEMGRSDDTEETIGKRIQEYNTKTLPVASFYAGQNKLHEVTGTGKVEEIFRDIAKILDSYS